MFPSGMVWNPWAPNKVSFFAWEAIRGRILTLAYDNFFLQASNNCITSLPEDLAHCLKLIKLDVEGNKLTMLSENMIASWVLLTELNASRNLLTGLPENIGRLSRLIRLDFHQNRISSIPASIKGCCSLAEFYMGNNVLSSLTAEIGALSLLGTLDLHSNQVGRHSMFGLSTKFILPVSNSSKTSDIPSLTLSCALIPIVVTTEASMQTSLHTHLKIIFNWSSIVAYLTVKGYPVEACKLRLQVLDLSNNSLSGLPPEIG
ncbi:Plant intracellular Ras-group-related LRR protein 6 [Vitis vinifera]|uniref:Plant intracellular Ras-group-related LRR protein 6 n=1 Tax=Vitis vinifera TaxID=29760 RepID=A0A438I8S4_VITVI|nr:Plant intracellular Ras-group-related LRR protein 6 [Vitis vinifera]